RDAGRHIPEPGSGHRLLGRPVVRAEPGLRRPGALQPGTRPGRLRAGARPRAATTGPRWHCDDLHVHIATGLGVLGRTASTGQRIPAGDAARVHHGQQPDGHSGAAFYYDAIKGAARCDTNPAPRTCDLSAGIITDDKARTVSFRLARPDPD